MIRLLLSKTSFKSKSNYFFFLFLISFFQVSANNSNLLNLNRHEETTKNSKLVPVAKVKDITVYLNNNGTISITPQDINDGSSVNTGTLNLSIDISTFNCSNVGNNSVTLTVSNGLGLTTTAIANVTVVDNLLPNINAQGVTINLDSNGSANINTNMIDNGTTDNCSIANIELSKYNFDCSDVGDNTVRITATDVNGNSNYKDVIVKIMDNEMPMIVMPDNITLEANSVNCSYIFETPLTVTATDNCAVDNITATRNDGLTLSDPFPIGNTTITWCATDVNGNMSGGGGGMYKFSNDKNTNNAARTSTMQIVTIVDTTAPIFTTVETHTLSLDTNGNAVFNTGDFNSNSVTDNCGVDTITFDRTNFTCNDLGTQTITATATDIYGNTSTGPVNIVIQDNTAPVVLTQNITIDLDPSGNASITTNMIDNGTTDNCNFVLSLDKKDFNCNDIGENIVQLTATDNSGNSASAPATVTVNNTALPTAITKNITIELDENGNASITPQMIDNSSNGSCGFDLTVDKLNFDCSNVGIDNIVTLTVTDGAGNTSSATAIVYVEDNIAPTVSTQNITVQLDENGSVTIAPEDVLVFSNTNNDTTEECTVTAAESHAMWLSKYIRNNDDSNDDDDDDNDEDDRFSRTSYQNARFIFNAKKGSLIKNPDGTAKIRGKLINTQNPKDKWRVVLNLKKKRNWNEWSALGRSWKGNSSVIGDRYLDWDYYEMANSSKLKGLGINKGKVINLSHAPTDKKYGFQLGDRANVKNNNFGLSGWFFYKNRYGNWVQGDFNLDVTDCDQNTNETATTYDNCAIESYTLDKDTFNCNDSGDNTVNITVTDINGNTTTKPVTVTVEGSGLDVSIEDFTLVSGQKKNTIFLGYKESVHLCPIVTGGENVTYQWTDDSGNIISTEAFPRITPGFSKTYTVTVTNNSGCSASASIEVCVIDARAYNKHGQRIRGKVKMCHHNQHYGSNSHQNIIVSNHYVNYYISCGATLGSCNSTCITEDDVVEEPSLELSLYPNPSCGVFYAKIKNLQENATVVLYNMYGRVIQRKYIHCVRNGENKVLMGSYYLRPGSYIVKVYTDGHVLTETMIVTSNH